jgi:hypothetical protein
MSDYNRKQLSHNELRERNTRTAAYNAWYRLNQENMFGIKEQPQRRSETIQESIKRVRRCMVYCRKQGRWISKFDAQQDIKSKFNLMANIDYWKKHGRLPEKNMAKVNGKGMYPV